MAEPGEADRDIGLGAADMHVEPAALQQQLAPRRGQPQQQFAEAEDLSGQRFLPFALSLGRFPARLQHQIRAGRIAPGGRFTTCTGRPIQEPFMTNPGVGMPCPVCKVALVMSDRQGVEIDYCPQCRGVWLDRGELDKIIERSAQEAAPRPRPSAPQRGLPRRRDGAHRDLAPRPPAILL